MSLCQIYTFRKRGTQSFKYNCCGPSGGKGRYACLFCFFLLKHYRPTNRPIAYFTDMDFIFILLFSLAQRRLASDKAKSVQREPGENVEQRLFNVLEKDESEGKAIQFMELSECLFGIYNQSAIATYLTWNQQLPLMIDATGLRIKQFRNKKHW